MMNERIVIVEINNFIKKESGSMPNYDYLETPIGLLEIEEQSFKITKITLVTRREKPVGKTLLLEKCKKELTEYFLGVRKDFDMEIELIGTEFQKQVWRELLKIPYGKTVSYSEIALAIQNPKAVRAVGGAIHHNPLLIIVPCHRVIGKNGSLTGFACGIEVKEKLLQLEKNQN